MSERRDPTTNNAPDNGADRDASTAFNTSSRALWLEWERAFVPSLPSDFTNEVMFELTARARAEAWERAFVPPLPEDFASTVARAAMDEEYHRSLMRAWAACVPALPEDFAQSVTEAALANEAAQDQRIRVAMRQWAEAKVPALPEDFAQSVVAMALHGEASTNTSSVKDKLAVLAPKGAAKRRWLAPAALSSIAAAAVAVLALTAGPRFRTQPNNQRAPHSHPPSLHNTQHGSPPQSVTLDNANHGATANAASTNHPEPEDGSEVEKVELDGERASFAAFSIAGEENHGAIAVVWIEDETKTSSAP